jgi:hypothetical protein
LRYAERIRKGRLTRTLAALGHEEGALFAIEVFFEANAIEILFGFTVVIREATLG